MKELFSEDNKNIKEIQVPNFEKWNREKREKRQAEEKAREQVEKQEKNSNRENEFKKGLKYTPKSKRKIKGKKTQNKKFKGKKKMAAIALAIGLSATAIAGGAKAVNDSRPITTAERQELGITLDQLGVDKDYQEKLTMFQEELDNSENLSIDELYKIRDEIVDWKRDALLSKVSHTIGVDKEELDTAYDGENSAGDERMVIYKLENGKKTVEYYQNRGDLYIDGSMDSKTAEYIKDIWKLQDIDTKDKNELTGELKKYLNETDKYIAGDVIVNDKGNMKNKEVTKGEYNREISKDDR